MKANAFFFLSLFLIIIFSFFKISLFKRDQVYFVLDYPYLMNNFKITKLLYLKDLKIYYLYSDYFNEYSPGDILSLEKFKSKENKIFFPQEIKVLKKSKISYFSFLRNYLKETIEKSLPWPEENILRGIILGDEIENHELKENFRKIGISHLFVASGGNLVIFTAIIYQIFKKLNFFYKNISSFLTLFFLLFYIFLVGFEGSILRASIFSFIFLLFKTFSGRIVLLRNILIFSIFIIILFSPFIFLEPGTILSYFSFIGIVYLAPFLEEKLKKYLNFENLISIFSSTFASFIFTFPLTGFFFGEINFYGLFFNLLFVPLVSLIFYFGLIFIFLPFFNKALYFLIIFISKISSLAKIFPELPLSLPPLFFVFYYLFLILIIYQLNKNENIEFNFALR